MIERKKKSSSKVNLVVSAVFHTLAIGALVFFAAREGMLGKKLKQLTVTMVPKEKKPEPPKEKPPEPKPEPPKVAQTPKPVVPMVAPKADTAPPPAVAVAPIAAPAPAILPSFEFSDGAKEVKTISDANGLYKATVEHALLSRWNRPDNIADDSFVAEVKLNVDPSGNVTSYQWLSGSGNARWDGSIKEALSQTKRLSRPPPKGFPPSFNVRFDVESLRTEGLQLSIQ